MASFFKKLGKKLKKFTKKYLEFTSGKTFYDKVQKKLTKSILKKVGGKKAAKFYDGIEDQVQGVVTQIGDSVTGGALSQIGGLTGLLPGESGGIPIGNPAPVQSAPVEVGELRQGSPLVVMGIVAAGAVGVYLLVRRKR